MQKSLVALSTLAALGLFACQPNTSDEATTTTTETTQAPSGSGESMTDAQNPQLARISHTSGQRIQKRVPEELRSSRELW